LFTFAFSKEKSTKNMAADLGNITEKQLKKFIDDGLYEDIREGDHTSLACIPKESRNRAKLLVKDYGIIAGVELAKRIFKRVDPTSKIDIRIPDGSDVIYGDVVFEVDCNSQALLKAERLLLNSMQRMSGIATLSNRFAFEVKDLPVTVLDTRKTTPLFRALEKWAVRIGGCSNYRDGLYDRIMIKDNHVDACGGVRKAIDCVKDYLAEKNMNLEITVEVRSMEELKLAIEEGGMQRIMLDNFDIPNLRQAVAFIEGRYQTEASGGISLETIRRYAQTGVNFISIGALTHSAKSLDLSLKVIK
jgi:nicotinate-nucleotide pyrophosphorylase (carboxylating)